MASVIYHCPWCGTELRDDGDLWCPGRPKVAVHVK